MQLSLQPFDQLCGLSVELSARRFLLKRFETSDHGLQLSLRFQELLLHSVTVVLEALLQIIDGLSPSFIDLSDLWLVDSLHLRKLLRDCLAFFRWR